MFDLVSAPVLQDTSPKAASKTSSPKVPKERERFIDGRAYDLFGLDATEKRETARWIVRRIVKVLGEREIPPSHLRLFDGCIGDAALTSGVVEGVLRYFPGMRISVGAKEMNAESLGRALHNNIAHLFEIDPTFAFAANNRPNPLAPSHSHPTSNGKSVTWKHFRLRGNTTYEFKQQIDGKIIPFLAKHWKSTKTEEGPLKAEEPTVIVVSRGDQQLGDLLPQKSNPRAGHDFVIASQPYQLKAGLDFKAGKVIAPLARGLGLGGRLFVIHSEGGDDSHAVARILWPHENFFPDNARNILKAVRRELTGDKRGGMYQYEVAGRISYGLNLLLGTCAIGTTVLDAAWNAATYAAQVPAEKIRKAVESGAYADATQKVLDARGGTVRFRNTVFEIARDPH